GIAPIRQPSLCRASGRMSLPAGVSHRTTTPTGSPWALWYVHRADRLRCRRSSSATASLAVANVRPPGAGLPLRVGVGPLFGGEQSASLRPTAARIAPVSQPAWHFTSAVPSSPWAMLRLARRSSWAGQRADQPLPAFLASDNLANRVSRGFIA